VNIFKALLSISARELTRRVVWLGSYVAYVHADVATHPGVLPSSTDAMATARAAVAAYDEEFPHA
jgi:cephalosporin hydroxylase